MDMTNNPELNISQVLRAAVPESDRDLFYSLYDISLQEQLFKHREAITTFANQNGIRTVATLRDAIDTLWKQEAVGYYKVTYGTIHNCPNYIQEKLKLVKEGTDSTFNRKNLVDISVNVSAYTELLKTLANIADLPTILTILKSDEWMYLYTIAKQWSRNLNLDMLDVRALIKQRENFTGNAPKALRQLIDQMLRGAALYEDVLQNTPRYPVAEILNSIIAPNDERPSYGQTTLPDSFGINN